MGGGGGAGGSRIDPSPSGVWRPVHSMFEGLQAPA